MLIPVRQLTLQEQEGVTGHMVDSGYIHTCTPQVAQVMVVAAISLLRVLCVFSCAHWKGVRHRGQGTVPSALGGAWPMQTAQKLPNNRNMALIGTWHWICPPNRDTHT